MTSCSTRGCDLLIGKGNIVVLQDVMMCQSTRQLHTRDVLSMWKQLPYSSSMIPSSPLSRYGWCKRREKSFLLAENRTPTPHRLGILKRYPSVRKIKHVRRLDYRLPGCYIRFGLNSKGMKCQNTVHQFKRTVRMSKTWLKLHWVNLFLVVCTKSTYLFCTDNRAFVNKNLNYNLLSRSDAADHSSFINVQKCQGDIMCRTFVHPYQRQSSQDILQVLFSYLGNAGAYWVVTVKERCVRWEA